MKWTISLLLLVFWSGLSAQATTRGRVLDAATDQALAYVQVAVAGTSRGTLTNEEGAFVIEAAARDTLYISYLGYELRRIAVRDLANGTIIRLQPQQFELPELLVKAEDPYLYNLLRKCGQVLRRAKQAEAKTYFEVSTNSDGQPVELVQCYYNATVRAAGVDRLDLKNGRVGLAAVGELNYVNLNTTRALSLLDLARNSPQFPATPLQLGRKEMYREYILRELPSAADDGLVRVFCLPRRDTVNFFGAEIWVDAENFNPVRVELRQRHLSRHPFVPILPGSELRDFHIELSYTFVESGNQPLLSYLELNYDLNLYHDRDVGQWRRTPFHTTGLVHCYDYEGAFKLPYFKYEGQYSDYRKISFLPYNAVFWAQPQGLE
ncbi:MAG: carboxypeptidase-like regulatory domain-containing protein, partial [Saprospiraceae bacterium]